MLGELFTEEIMFPHLTLSGDAAVCIALQRREEQVEEGPNDQDEEKLESDDQSCGRPHHLQHWEQGGHGRTNRRRGLGKTNS